MASTYFDDQWLGMEAYKEWLLRDDDRTSAKCRMCPIPRNKIELSSMDQRAIKSHAKGKKHCDRLALYFRVAISSLRLYLKDLLSHLVHLLHLLVEILWINL